MASPKEATDAMVVGVPAKDGQEGVVPSLAGGCKAEDLVALCSSEGFRQQVREAVASVCRDGAEECGFDVVSAEELVELFQRPSFQSVMETAIKTCLYADEREIREVQPTSPEGLKVLGSEQFRAGVKRLLANRRQDDELEQLESI